MMTIRNIVFGAVVAAALVSPSNAEGFLSGVPELDTAQLRVRPNVADYDIPVSTFWECLSHAPRKPIDIAARKSGSESIVVRVTTRKDLWTDFYFQLSGSNAILRRLKNSDGSSTQNWQQLRGYVDVVGNACSDSDTSEK